MSQVVVNGTVQSPARTRRPPCITVSPWRFLTHLPLDKMAAVLADNIFKCMFLNENFYILIKIPLKFVPKGPIDNNPALV